MEYWGWFEKPKHVPTPAASSILHIPSPRSIKKVQRYLRHTRQKKGVVSHVVCAASKSPRIRAPQPKVARDPRNICIVPPYERQRHVQNKTTRHCLEDAGTLKTRPEQIFDTPFRPGKEAPQTRVDIIRRGTSKCCHPTATIYPRDQDYQGHVESVRIDPSCRVHQKQDRSSDGRKRHNQGWLNVQLEVCPRDENSLKVP